MMEGDRRPPPLHPECTRVVPDVLRCGIAKLIAGEAKPEPRHRGTEATTELGRERLTEKMRADRWTCAVARLQRRRTVGEGAPQLKIVGRVLYRVQDIGAYEEA